MTTLAEHVQLLTARRDWLRAKQAAYDTQREALRQATSTYGQRSAADALVPLARELNSAAERIYQALVPALRAVNPPAQGMVAAEVERLRALCQDGITKWATAQAALQEYRGAAGQPGPAAIASIRVPVWQAYTVGPTGLVGALETAQAAVSQSRQQFVESTTRDLTTAARSAGTAAAQSVSETLQQEAQKQQQRLIYAALGGLALLGIYLAIKKDLWQ